MKKTTYILIAALVLCALSLPLAISNKFRSGMAAIFSVFPRSKIPQIQKEIEVLRTENHSLHCQMEILKAQIDVEKILNDEIQLLKHDFCKKRKDELLRVIELYSSSIVSKVIFREYTSWNSSFWIDVGEKTNQRLGKNLVSKNSPVVLGTTVVGVVEYVGNNRSRVRLITDSTVSPSIRALRNNQYRGKGELKGIRKSGFRARSMLLQGVGFNYDFEDEEGPSRDLRSDQIISEGDTLITTGLDGVFPGGLGVGKVTKVHPLKEGASSYEVDLTSFIENFNTISFVTVLPALEND